MRKSLSRLAMISGAALMALSTLPQQAAAYDSQKLPYPGGLPLPNIPVGRSEVKIESIGKYDKLQAYAYFATDEESKLPSVLEMQRTCFSQLIREELKQGKFADVELKSFMRDPFRDDLQSKACFRGSGCHKDALEFRLQNKSNGEIRRAAAYVGTNYTVWRSTDIAAPVMGIYECRIYRTEMKIPCGAIVDDIRFSFERAPETHAF